MTHFDLFIGTTAVLMPMAMILYCDDRIARFVGKTPSKEEAEYLDYRH